MFLTIDSSAYSAVNIPVDGDTGAGEVRQVLVGDPGERGPHGTYLSAVKARKLETIPVTTWPMLPADAIAACDVLESAPPLLASGDWLEALGADPAGIDVLCGPIARQIVPTGDGLRVILRFDLTEI